MLKKLLFILLGFIGLIAVLIVAAYIAGTFIPQGHVATRTARFKTQPETIWKMVTTPQNYTHWRKGVKELKMLDSTADRESWTEVDQSGDEVSFRVKSKTPMSKYEIEIINDPTFGGYWEYTLEPADGGTKLTITEHGEIYSPIFRTIAKLFFDFHDTLDTYFGDLAQKIGESYQKP